MRIPSYCFPLVAYGKEGQTNNKYKMVREFAKLARVHYSNTVKSQNPQQFRKAIKNIASYLCDGDQHDSHEFLVPPNKRVDRRTTSSRVWRRS